MATDTTAGPVISARIRPTFALQAVSEIELRYDGASPPVGLLDALGALGWDGAAPCPPPADAIDWSRPDPVRGTRHSIRSFPASTTAVLRGTDAHRASVVEATRSLLGSFGIVDEGVSGPSRSPAGHPHPAEGVAPMLAEHLPGPAGPGSVEGALSSGRQVTVVVASAHATEALRRLADWATVVDDQPDLWTTAITYRGNSQRTDHPARRIVVRLGRDEVDLVAVLAGLTVWSLQ